LEKRHRALKKKKWLAMSENAPETRGLSPGGNVGGGRITYSGVYKKETGKKLGRPANGRRTKNLDVPARKCSLVVGLRGGGSSHKEAETKGWRRAVYGTIEANSGTKFQLDLLKRVGTAGGIIKLLGCELKI